MKTKSILKIHVLEIIVIYYEIKIVKNCLNYEYIEGIITVLVIFNTQVTFISAPVSFTLHKYILFILFRNFTFINIFVWNYFLDLSI